MRLTPLIRRALVATGMLATGAMIGVLDTPRRLEAIPQCACYLAANYLPNSYTCVGTLQANVATTCSRGTLNEPCNISGSFDWTPGACAQTANPDSQVQATNAATGAPVVFDATQQQTNSGWGAYTFTCWSTPGQLGSWEAAIRYWYWTGNCNCYDSGIQTLMLAAEGWRCEF